jgi:uncharacterized protein with LGFP repeats
VSCRRSRIALAVSAVGSTLLLTGALGVQAADAQTARPMAAQCAYAPAAQVADEVGESPISQRYESDPELRALLGAPISDEVGDAIRYREYEHGRMYWSESTGARATYGDILAKYLDQGGHEAFGAPITDECPALDGGRYNHFTGTAATGVTSIYWRPDLGAELIWGQVRALWERSGWERGTYGFPTTDTAQTRDGTGLFNDFTGGDNAGAAIYWTPPSGVHGVKGAILAKWRSLDAENSFLGYPTSDEYDISIGKRSDFQGGYITWNAATGELMARPY